MASAKSFDCAIIGGGPGGCLLAWILANHGRRVVIVDRQQHPRFAVGESSTPIADNTLRRLGERYQLQPLIDLARWGSWQTRYPHLACGKKRGFSYFFHRKGAALRDVPDDRLLVAANPSDAESDTHWFRADVDHFFAEQAIAAGVEYYNHSEVTSATDRNGACELAWRNGPADSRPQTDRVRARFIVDASGQSRVIPRLLGWPDTSSRLWTKTQSTFTHVSGCVPWTEILEQQRFETAGYPFNVDDTAQHHLFDGGWLWALRFNNGRTSVGWTRPACGSTHVATEPTLVDRLGCSGYPLLEGMLGKTVVCDKPGRWIHVSHLQHWHRQVIGPNMALLPTTAATLDPLHSTGLAHMLTGVERLADILLHSKTDEERDRRLVRYQIQVNQEIRLLDRLISTAYLAMGSMPLFTAACMLYFAVAIRHEELRAATTQVAEATWGADQPSVQAAVAEGCQRIRAIVQSRDASSTSTIESALRSVVRRLTQVPLLVEEAGGLYAYTFGGK